MPGQHAAYEPCILLTREARSFLMSSKIFFSSASGMLLCCRRPSSRPMASSIFSTEVYSILPFMLRTCSLSDSRPWLMDSSSVRTCFFCACTSPARHMSSYWEEAPLPRRGGGPLRPCVSFLIAMPQLRNQILPVVVARA